MAKEESTRSVTKRLRKAGFERVSTDGRHSKWVHPSGAWVPVPDSHRTISPGVVRKIDKAIAETQSARPTKASDDADNTDDQEQESEE